MNRASVALALFVSAIACSSGEIHYTPESDAAFATSVVGVYTSGTMTLSVCEDAAPGGLACQTTSTSDCGGSCHVIRGGGRASAESIPAAGRGCDCSTPSAELPVVADLTLLDGSHLALRGTVATAPAEDDPYGAPFALRVATSDEHLATALRGEIRSGTARLRLSPLPADAGPGAWPADTTSAVAFARSGPCP